METTEGAVACIKIPYLVLSVDLAQNGCRVSAVIMNAEAFHSDVKLRSLVLRVQTNGRELSAVLCCR
jgi:hypothetical protein